MKKPNTIAMLLAGGQGSRLEQLTSNNAKPGVMFGGKYRIIDFSLSNCFHSEIYTVGVMTQYKPLLLNRYIGNGGAWALDKVDQGVYILPPYMRKDHAEWYRGTADAVYQNFEFIEMYDPEYVVILSGDHIYQMNYSYMIEKMIEKDADLTVCVMEVPWEETYRFGIVNTDDDDRIIEFEEKPEDAKNNLASMGIYVFKWSVLKDVLTEDRQNESSSHDFGKDVIPKMIADQKKVYSYVFNHYWRDVGTVDSYYKTNMELLEDRDDLDLTSNYLRVYSNNANREPHFIAETGYVKKSLVADGSYIAGSVYQSILAHDVFVEEGATVKDSIIFGNVTIKKGAVIEKAIIGEGLIIDENTSIGSLDSSDVTLRT
ncbi:glucose-1-phosphate adenylyltransferase [Pelagirhabdus alkalitolerans]|uniref:Glucose-1-phosphate adenylyltransferase n=1 Tax=Pelagirhabdus alkalitolerans TaxID=1612202 RepID=A0A1G6KBW6_9BACI|nr:glucose-1-phosphate adenylyltransferase [Pelagirhabdus alkalitolerans]SDC28065.1 glucose-1-phosphate adenylyltransferase [Pelagirhabdus alkalitolerans]